MNVSKAIVSAILSVCIISIAGFALTGIGVSDHFGPDATIRVYFVANDKLHHYEDLYKNRGGYGICYSTAINTYGSHVAFMKHTDNGVWVSVMRSDGANKNIKDLVKIDQTNCFLDWPRGDWVYYNNESTRRQVYKVNVHTGKTEKVMTIGGDVCELKFSTINGLLHANIAKRHVLKVGEGALKDANWDQGGTVVGGGCTPTISPSGTYITGTTNSGHTKHGIMKLGISPRTMENVGSVDVEKWNAWSVDNEFACTYPDGFIETVGSGVVGGKSGKTGSSFSCNSDKWVCYAIGWKPAGRFEKNGVNFVAINWMDEKSLNVSRHPKTAGKGCYVDSINERCPCGVVDTTRQTAYNLDLWVQSPIEDVLPKLREDVANHGKYRISGLDDGVKAEAMRNTPPFANSAATMRRGVSGEIVLRARQEILPLTMEMFSLDGRLLFKKAVLSESCRLSRQSIPRGAVMMRLRCKSNGCVLKKVVPGIGF